MLARSLRLVVAFSTVLAVSPLALVSQAPQQKLNAFDLSRAHQMLHDAYYETVRNYYDPKFHGVDIDARYRDYDKKIDSAASLGAAFRVVAAFFSGFHDSHLFFEPPMRETHFDSGYRMQMVGDKCLVTRVRPGSDAAGKVHTGDQIIHFNGYDINSEDFSDMQYYFRVLAPAGQEHVDLKAPDGSLRAETINSLTKTNKLIFDLTSGAGDGDFWDLVRRGETDEHMNRERLYETGNVAIWKMARFGFEIETLNRIMGRIRKDSVLILDLRGNPGGYTDSLQWLIGRLFDHDVKISDRVTRKPDKPQLAKHTGTPFTGKIIVLVDRNSASSSELFARVMQLEHRGTVLGDKTAGAVMEARSFGESQGVDTKIFYGFSITRANLLMADGKSLEGTGVTPDELILPTAADLAEGRDPVLARAATLAGLSIDAQAAGKLFPYEWQSL